VKKKLFDYHNNEFPNYPFFIFIFIFIFISWFIYSIFWFSLRFGMKRQIKSTNILNNTKFRFYSKSKSINQINKDYSRGQRFIIIPFTKQNIKRKKERRNNNNNNNNNSKKSFS
jgi:hypothetical protein